MTRRIIKYSNRRLYDAARGRPITLLEVSDLMAAGERVRVELKDTGEDITVVTLLQAILERLKQRPRTLLGAEDTDRLLGSVRTALGEDVGSEDRPVDLRRPRATPGLPD
jgi:polyhydroxyalkanoate synthesis regulator protein